MDEVLFKCTFPVQKHVVKKNGRDIIMNKATGRMFPGKSKELRAAENYLILQFRNFWWRMPGPHTKIDYFVNCKILFHFDAKNFFTAKGRVNKNIPDLSNLYQLVEDCLQTAGVIDDDHFVASHDGSRRVPDTENLLTVELTRI